MHRVQSRFLIFFMALAMCGLAAPAVADDVGGDDTGVPAVRRSSDAPSASAPPEPDPVQVADVGGDDETGAPRTRRQRSTGSDCKWFPDIRCGRHGRFEGFEMPISQPFLFEDPFITTGIYPYYVWHEFPTDSALGGGDAHILAVQARVAITDRLAFIATKDGYAWYNPDNPLLRDETGWYNIAAGLKYALIQRPEDNFILSTALKMEFPTGSKSVFEGAGSSVLFIPQISAAWGWNKLHLIGDVGGMAGTDSDIHSSQFFFHAYADYTVHKHFQPWIQFSGQHIIGSGAGERPVRLAGGGEIDMATAIAALGLDGFEGVDVQNYGNPDVGGNFISVFAVGTHIPINQHFTLSVGWEMPITSRQDIHEQRVTTAVRMEF